MNATANLAPMLICAARERRRVLFAASAAQAAAGNATEFPTGMHLPSVERVLAKNQLLAVPDANANVTCLDGELWLTREGDSEDYILGPGQSFTSRRGDKVAVQALRPSRLRLAAT